MSIVRSAPRMEAWTHLDEPINLGRNFENDGYLMSDVEKLNAARRCPAASNGGLPSYERVQRGLY